MGRMLTTGVKAKTVGLMLHFQDTETTGRKLTGAEKEKAINDYMKKQSKKKDVTNKFIPLDEMRKQVKKELRG